MPTRTRFRLLPLVLILAGILCVSPVAAQHQVGLHFDVGVPAGEFADNAEDPGFGGSLHYAYAANSRLSFGMGSHFLIYGSESRTMSLPLVQDFEVKTSNNIAGIFLLSQFNLMTGPVTPYLEGRFGGQYLWTESKLVDVDWFEDDDIAAEVNYDDFALQYGIGGGFRIRISDGGGRGDPSVMIDVKFMFMNGGEAEYLTEGDIDIVADNAILRPSETETDLTHFELGVVLEF